MKLPPGNFSQANRELANRPPAGNATL